MGSVASARDSHDAVLFIAFIGRELMPRYKAFPQATSKYQATNAGVILVFNIYNYKCIVLYIYKV